MVRPCPDIQFQGLIEVADGFLVPLGGPRDSQVLQYRRTGDLVRASLEQARRSPQQGRIVGE
jgi:hypothetical protein